MTDALAPFLSPIQSWFRQAFREPTPPQALGWPAIQGGDHVLILSPTGSGKTLAAFLWGMDSIYRTLATHPDGQGVQLLYISPLKALNNDIERNLRAPREAIGQAAKAMGAPLPPLRVAVRTGDTPSSARQAMVRKPPHILITTPESLYLILTSPRAREMLRSVRTVIVDEIHTLCGNKRGVHLALSLERLTAMTETPPQRIGLSATQRPLDEVARFLVGQEWATDEDGEALGSRSVTIIDAGAQKRLDLRVVTPVPDLRQIPGGSIWPHTIPKVLEEIRRRHTTLVFVNSRRAAERAADRLNEQYALESDEVVAPGSPSGLLRDGVPHGQGMFGTGRTEGPFRAHHGSVAREVRLELETRLKSGELPALIGTSSLELGIDIGSVDAVIQLQSPRGIARGLQRVGRSGHLVGQTSVGRIYATHREDLLDAAAVAHGMLHGDIEPTYAPQNCLDILAQQIVAMVSVQDWDAQALYGLARQAYGYANLPYEAFTNVLKLLTGGYPSDVFRGLRARIAWDRVHDRLSALPGSRLLAIRNGGTIADRGEFRVVLPDGKTTLGTLDEEFVFETRRGDVFTLGSNTWRVIEIDEDKLTVAEAEGSMPRMPFWNGELPKRDYHMGLRLGALRRELAARVVDLDDPLDDLHRPWGEAAHETIDWLGDEYALDEASARNAMHYVRSQMDVLGAISSDRTIVVELFADALGDQRIAIHSPFGGRVNSAWGLALTHALRETIGGGRSAIDVETQVSDDGILFRVVQADRDRSLAEIARDLVERMGSEEVRRRLLWELPESALFGAQFRMNATRALVLPRVSGARRTPFWLQRLRARDLLAAAKGLDDFPLIVETYRDCLRDVLDVQHLTEVLDRIADGAIRVVVAETLVPSPVASSLLFDFINVGMYEGDQPKLTQQIQALSINRELLSELLDDGVLPELLRPEALDQVQAELQHQAEGFGARSPEELALLLQELGDLTGDEIAARSVGEGRAWLLRLAGEGRVAQVPVPGGGGTEQRWINAEDYARYRDAFGLPKEPPVPLPAELLAPRRTPDAAREALLRRHMRTHGPQSRQQIRHRYAFPEAWLDATLSRLTETGVLVSGRLSPNATERQWCDRSVLERIHRRTLSVLRKELKPAEAPALCAYMLRWQGLDPGTRLRGRPGLIEAIERLRGLTAPAMSWERDILPARVADYRPEILDELTRDGASREGIEHGTLAWSAEGGDATHARVRLFFRGEGRLFLPSADVAAEAEASLGDEAKRALSTLREEGALFASDLRDLLSADSATTDGALVELALAGLITNDAFEALRILARGDFAQKPSPRAIRSSLDDALGEWRSQRARRPLHRPSAERMRRARANAAAAAVPATRWGGRWASTRRASFLGPALSVQERATRLARQMLLRYGIVTREIVQADEGPWSWSEIYGALRRMELRGEVRRGYLVRGLSGVQFALADAVEMLRACAKPDAADPALVVVSACDPALVVAALPNDVLDELGAGLPDEANPYQFARVPSNLVVVQHGVPILLYEHGSARLTTLPRLADDTLSKATTLLVEHLTRPGGLCASPPRVTIATWNGRAPIGSAIQDALAAVGFRREALDMVWDGL